MPMQCRNNITSVMPHAGATCYMAAWLLQEVHEMQDPRYSVLHDRVQWLSVDAASPLTLLQKGYAALKGQVLAQHHHERLVRV